MFASGGDARIAFGICAKILGLGKVTADKLTTENHLHTTASALKRWAIAQLQDSLAVGVLWMLGLWIIRVPWAPLWAVLAAALQIIPHFGPILSLLAPVLSAALRWHDWQQPLFVPIL